MDHFTFFGYIFYKIQSKPNKKADEANKARNAVFLIITGGWKDFVSKWKISGLCTSLQFIRIFPK